MPGFLSQDGKLLYLARSFVSFGIRRQALTEGTVLRLAKAWSMTGWKE